MDKELYIETLNIFCGFPIYEKYYESFNMINLENMELVYGKYLYVSPPIPGIINNQKDTAWNFFCMKYNEAYNTKYNINPFDCSSYESSTD